MKIDYRNAEKERPLKFAVRAGPKPDGIDLEMDKLARKTGVGLKTHNEPNEEHDIGHIKIDPKEREKLRSKANSGHKN